MKQSEDEEMPIVSDLEKSENLISKSVFNQPKTSKLVTIEPFVASSETKPIKKKRTHNRSRKIKKIGIISLVVISSIFVLLLGIQYIENNWSKGTVVITNDDHREDQNWRVEVSENGKKRFISGTGQHQFMVKGKDVTVNIEYDDFVTRNCLIIYEGDIDYRWTNFDWEDINCDDGKVQSVSLHQNSLKDFAFTTCLFSIVGLLIIVYMEKNNQDDDLD